MQTQPYKNWKEKVRLIKKISINLRKYQKSFELYKGLPSLDLPIKLKSSSLSGEELSLSSISLDLLGIFMLFLKITYI